MPTETADTRFTEIDQWPTRKAVEAMLENQSEAIAAVVRQTAQIAEAAEAAAKRLGERGRIAYCGAGTSGRIGVQDGVELTPTYGWPEDRLVFLLAGGEAAVTGAVEGAEDDAEAARAAVRDHDLEAADVLIGVAASGRTPFTVAAVEEARERVTLTIGIACNPDTALLHAAEHPILIDTGSEAIAGSTRMKAGTAQKVVLNLLSTAIMLRLGMVHRGLMIDMRVSNAKLMVRAIEMVAQIAGVDRAAAEAALEQTGRNVRLAILVAMGLSPDEASRRARPADGDFGRLIAAIRAGQ